MRAGICPIARQLTGSSTGSDHSSPVFAHNQHGVIAPAVFPDEHGKFFPVRRRHDGWFGKAGRPGAWRSSFAVPMFARRPGLTDEAESSRLAGIRSCTRPVPLRASYWAPRDGEPSSFKGRPGAPAVEGYGMGNVIFAPARQVLFVGPGHVPVHNQPFRAVAIDQAEDRGHVRRLGPARVHGQALGPVWPPSSLRLVPSPRRGPEDTRQKSSDRRASRPCRGGRGE